MSRLTKRNKNGEAYVISGIGVCRFGQEIEKLAHYEDLEEQGRLIELPCKVGDTVYFIHHTRTKPVIAETKSDEFMLALCVMENRFGKTAFLTKAEAEAKLEEMRGGQHEEIQG